MAVAMEWGWLSSSNNNKNDNSSNFPSKNSSTSASSSSSTQQHLLSNPSSVKQWDWDGPSSSPPHPPPTMAIMKSSSSSSATIVPPSLETVDLQASMPVPWGWERCLDLKSGQVYLARSGKDKLEMEEEGKLRKNTNTHNLVGSESSKLLLEKSKLTIDWLQGKTPLYNNVTSVEEGDGAGEDEEAVVGGAPHGKDFRAPVELKLFNDVSVDLELNLRTTTTTTSTTITTTRDSESLNKNKDNNNIINNNDDTDGQKLPISFTELLLQSSKDRPLLVERPNWVESLGIAKKSIPASKSPPRHMLPRSSLDDDASSAMATAACSKCLMYVLLWKNNPSCPKCGSPVFLDYPNNNHHHHHHLNRQEDEPEEGHLPLHPFKRGRHHGPNNNGTFFTIEDCSLALSNHHETNQTSKPTAAPPYYKLWQT